MGVCESCMKAEADTEPLLSKMEKDSDLVEISDVKAKSEESKDFFQTIIEEANGKFISSDYRHTQRTNQRPDEIRYVIFSSILLIIIPISIFVVYDISPFAIYTIFPIKK
jgi:hypothetical protein